MKRRHAIILLTIILSVVSMANTDAAPWRRYRRSSTPMMRYADGCRNYCKVYDGCKRCYRHVKHSSNYVTR